MEREADAVGGGRGDDEEEEDDDGGGGDDAEEEEDADDDDDDAAAGRGLLSPSSALLPLFDAAIRSAFAFSSATPGNGYSRNDLSKNLAAFSNCPAS